MRKRSLFLLIFCTLFALLASRELGAQITVLSVRGLAFGTVIPGVPSVVSRTDPVNSGQFEIRGPFLTFIRLTFTLPTVLNGPLGATMPVSFATNDAGYSFNNTITNQNAFNPNQPYTTLIWIGGRSGVWLGGGVTPTVGQRAGAYTGTVVLSVVVL
jgi:hypothetical protein